MGFQSQQESEDENEDNQLFTLKHGSKQDQNHKEQICSNNLQKQENIVSEKVTATETYAQNAAIQQMFKIQPSDDEENDIQPTGIEDFTKENSREPATLENNLPESSAVFLQLFESQQQFDDEGVEGNEISLTGLKQLHAADTNMEGVNIYEKTMTDQTAAIQKLFMSTQESDDNEDIHHEIRPMTFGQMQDDENAATKSKQSTAIQKLFMFEQDSEDDYQDVKEKHLETKQTSLISSEKV